MWFPGARMENGDVGYSTAPGAYLVVDCTWHMQGMESMWIVLYSGMLIWDRAGVIYIGLILRFEMLAAFMFWGKYTNKTDSARRIPLKIERHISREYSIP